MRRRVPADLDWVIRQGFPKEMALSWDFKCKKEPDTGKSGDNVWVGGTAKARPWRRNEHDELKKKKRRGVYVADGKHILAEVGVG